MDPSSRVNDGILAAKILQNIAGLRNNLSTLLSLKKNCGRIDHSEDRIALLWYHKAKDAVDAKVEVINLVALFIHADIVSFEMWA